MIKVLVVDDEPLAVEELSNLINEKPHFEVTATASNGKQALQLLKKNKFDAVFLDIEMPEMNGLEVASRLVDWPEPPCVVFATAFNQYAVEAFEANAMDYVLKPYDEERLEKTCERIQEFVEKKESQHAKLAALEENLIQKGMVSKILGSKRGSKDRLVVNPDEVFYFYAHNTEVLACLGESELIVNATLKELLEKLDAAKFAQTHKGYITNIDKIEKVAPMFSGNFQITLKAKALEPIPLSRRYAKALKERLGGW